MISRFLDLDNDVSRVAFESMLSGVSDMSKIYTLIPTMLEERMAATQETARNVDQATASTREVAFNILGVPSASSEASHTVAQVQGPVDALSRQSNALQREVGTFLNSIKAK